jgi:hypothetical protein
LGAPSLTSHRWPNGSRMVPPRPYGDSVTGRISSAPSSTARLTARAGSGTSMRMLAPPDVAATWPISSNSSASISSDPPISSSACPTRPSSITIGSPRRTAPNTST